MTDDIVLRVSGNGWAEKRWYEYKEQKFPTMTKLLKALNKPALVGWAAKSVAEYAAQNYQQVYAIASEDTAAAVDLLKGAPYRNRDKAASLGVRVHALARHGGTPDADEAPYVEAWNRWLEESGEDIVAQEVPVVNTAVGYAGTLDLITCNADGEHILRDIKTGKTVAARDGVYLETRLQLNGYAAADVGLPVSIDRAAVLHIRPDAYKKGYREYPVELDLAPMLPHLFAVASLMGLTGTGGKR